MRVLVTGGTGFIGSHLVEALLAQGRDVRCLQHLLFRAFGDGTWMPEDSDPGDPRDGLRELFQTLAD